MKILYAEDTEALRYLLEVLFTSQGHTIITATNGELALDLLKHETFDLIISDILMPKMDGFSLCYQVKQTPVLADIPFIFYSATYTQPGDIRFAKKLGADWNGTDLSNKLLN